MTLPCIKNAVIETAVQSPHLRREELKSLRRMWRGCGEVAEGEQGQGTRNALGMEIHFDLWGQK